MCLIPAARRQSWGEASPNHLSYQPLGSELWTPGLQRLSVRLAPDHSWAALRRADRPTAPRSRHRSKRGALRARCSRNTRRPHGQCMGQGISGVAPRRGRRAIRDNLARRTLIVVATGRRVGLRLHPATVRGTRPRRCQYYRGVRPALGTEHTDFAEGGNAVLRARRPKRPAGRLTGPVTPRPVALEPPCAPARPKSGPSSGCSPVEAIERAEAVR